MAIYASSIVDKFCQKLFDGLGYFSGRYSELYDLVMSLGKREIMRIEEQRIDQQDLDDQGCEEVDQSVSKFYKEDQTKNINSNGEKQQEREQQHPKVNGVKNENFTDIKNSDFEGANKEENEQENIPSDERINEERFSYEEVSQQLQKALNKIKTQKNIQKSSFLERMQYFEIKKEKKLRKNKQQLEFKQSQNYSRHSLVNAKSQKILDNYQPIYQRYQKCIKQKQKKVQLQKMQKLLKQQEQQQKHIKREIKISDPRSNQQFLREIKKWEEMKQKKIIAKIQESLQQQMKGITFNPQIDSKSQEIVIKKGRVPIIKRQIKGKKHEIDDYCTFHPNLKKGL